MGNRQVGSIFEKRVGNVIHKIKKIIAINFVWKNILRNNIHTHISGGTTLH
jgi:hypothetical protein